MLSLLFYSLTYKVKTLITILKSLEVKLAIVKALHIVEIQRCEQKQVNISFFTFIVNYKIQ